MNQSANDLASRHMFTDVELAAYLGIKVATLRKWRVTGQGIPWIKLNGTLVRYLMSDVAAYLNSCPRGGKQHTTDESVHT